MASYFDTAEALTRRFVKRHGTEDHLAVWVGVKPSALFDTKILFRAQVEKDLIKPFEEAVSLGIHIPQLHLDTLFDRSFYDMVRYLDAAAKEAALSALRKDILLTEVPGLPA